MIKNYHSWKICYTPQKFNMEPENERLEKEILVSPSSLGSMLIFGGVYPLAFLGASFKPSVSFVIL